MYLYVTGVFLAVLTICSAQNCQQCANPFKSISGVNCGCFTSPEPNTYTLQNANDHCVGQRQATLPVFYTKECMQKFWELLTKVYDGSSSPPKSISYPTLGKVASIDSQSPPTVTIGWVNGGSLKVTMSEDIIFNNFPKQDYCVFLVHDSKPIRFGVRLGFVRCDYDMKYHIVCHRSCAQDGGQIARILPFTLFPPTPSPAPLGPSCCLCPCGWEKYGGSCYLYTATNANALAHYQVCSSYQFLPSQASSTAPAHLISIADVEEVMWVQLMRAKYGDGNSLVWTDGTDYDVEGVWRWTSSGNQIPAIFMSSYWAQGRPLGGVNDNDFLAVQTDGNWIDVPYQSLGQGICELDLPTGC